MNLCLFSTSGVHGSYMTIEEFEEEMILSSEITNEEESTPEITFLIICPRTVTLYYGNCCPKTQEDIEYLKRLRQLSWNYF